MVLYAKILDYCSKNQLSISGFEKKCGLSNGAVSKWENNGYPSIPTLKKIEIATGVPISEWVK